MIVSLFGVHHVALVQTHGRLQRGCQRGFGLASPLAIPRGKFPTPFGASR